MKVGERTKNTRNARGICSVIFFYLIVSLGGQGLAQSNQPADFDRLAAAAARARDADRVEEAVRLYREALRLRPKWGEGWFYLATLLYERDDYAEAARSFREVTELNPTIGTAWVMLGLCEFRLDRHDDSLKHLRKGRELGITDNPNLRSVMLYHEGLLLLDQSDFETAYRTLGLLAKDEVDNADLLTAIGLAALRIRYSNLPALDQTARQILPRIGRAEYLTIQKKFDKARDEYERLIGDFPKAPNVQYAYGRYLLASNDDGNAVAAFKRELENNPEHLLAHLTIADIKLRLKDYAGGLPHAEEAVKLRPQLPLGHYLLGALLLETGNTARSVTELETARRLLPDEPKIYFALGRAYARANRKDDAERARAVFERLTQQIEGAKDNKQ